jgi:mycothiol synthase
MANSGLTVRPAVIGEAPGIAELGRRHTERWSGVPAGRITAEFIESSFTMPGADPEHDFWSFELDGRLVAALMVWGVEPYSEVEIVKFVDPDLSALDSDRVRKALVRTALETAEPYARLAGAGVEPQAVIQAWPGEPIAAILRGEGFESLRSNFTMVRTLQDAVQLAALPSDVVARPIEVDRDLEGVVEVTTAFSDHHGDLVLTADQVRHFLEGPGGRPDLSRLAHDAQGPCSLVITEVSPDGGVVAVLATLRRARGRGLGTALLHEAFAALRADGATVVRLNVDAENTTGALRLYEGAGMVRESEVEIWARPMSR